MGSQSVQIEYNQTKGGVQVKHEDGHYSPEELVAMLLTHGKDITKTFGGSYVHDCVIVTPSFYTQHEKQVNRIWFSIYLYDGWDPKMFFM